MITLRVILLILCASIVSIGCDRPGVVPDSAMTLELNNGTTVPVALVVSGLSVMRVEPHTQVRLTAHELPSLPWHARVNLLTGRMLLELTVNSGDVRFEGSVQLGAAARVDLSCGRIDLWSGTPLLGPPPGRGQPGDCA